MQTAPGQVAQDSPNRPDRRAAGSRRARARRFVRNPVTLAVAGFVALIAVGAMLMALFGLWPPGGRTELTGLLHLYHPAVYRDTNGAIRSITPTSVGALGLKVEKAGAPRHEGGNVIVPLKVTNEVKMSAAGEGASGGAAPTPAPANVYNGTIKVIFYKTQDGKREVVGSGVGSVTNLQYGQTKQIEVIATAVGDFTDYEAFADSVWTDKDPVKAQPGAGTQNANTGGATPAAGTTPAP